MTTAILMTLSLLGAVALPHLPVADSSDIITIAVAVLAALTVRHIWRLPEPMREAR